MFPVQVQEATSSLRAKYRSLEKELYYKGERMDEGEYTFLGCTAMLFRVWHPAVLNRPLLSHPPQPTRSRPTTSRTAK